MLFKLAIVGNSYHLTDYMLRGSDLKGFCSVNKIKRKLDRRTQTKTKGAICRGVLLNYVPRRAFETN